MIIADKTDALENKRLEYRYLDIRRECIKNNLIARSKVNKTIRDFFDKNGFIEIETPTITKPTPGGAGEFVVKSENHKGKHFALTQSPQVYKQLLMYGGIDGYYQIARCYRDEDSRADRQIEFTQLDIEKSFTNQKEIRNYISDLLFIIVKQIRNIEIDKNFPILTYDDAIEQYGSDKPDIRFENKLINLTKIFANSNYDFIKNSINNEEELIGVIFEETISSSKIKKIEQELKQQGAKGLA
jgi:aspartyl-tRNA synthetase